MKSNRIRLLELTIPLTGCVLPLLYIAYVIASGAVKEEPSLASFLKVPLVVAGINFTAFCVGATLWIKDLRRKGKKWKDLTEQRGT